MATAQETTRGRQEIPNWKDLDIGWEDIRDIKDYLELVKGWEVREGGDTGNLVYTEPGCTVNCFDGRSTAQETDPNLQRAIYIPGGAYGVGAISRFIDRRHGHHKDLLLEGCDVIRRAGYKPTFHGDEKHGTDGCGFINLWIKGELEGLHGPPMFPDRARELAQHDPQSLLYYELTNGHQESALAIIAKKGMTRIPDGTMFHITPWAGPLFGIDPYNMVVCAADVIEKLNGPRIAILYR